MIDERIAERRAGVRDQRRRRRLRRTVAITLTVAVLVALVLVERSALVGLEEVQVTGTERLTQDDIRDAAALELGTSTLRLGLAAAEARVEALPLVLEARARRQDPLTVVIEVVERQPVVAVVGRGEARLVDRDGVVLVDGELAALPVIRLPHAPPLPGDEATSDPTLANAHGVWQQLSGPLRAQVRVYEAAGPDELDLELASGIRVRFGRAERVDEKVRALGAVLGDLGDADVEAIDVRAPGTPVVVGG